LLRLVEGKNKYRRPAKGAGPAALAALYTGTKYISLKWVTGAGSSHLNARFGESRNGFLGASGSSLPVWPCQFRLSHAVFATSDVLCVVIGLNDRIESPLKKRRNHARCEY
jgi:hypothetical protein